MNLETQETEFPPRQNHWVLVSPLPIGLSPFSMDSVGMLLLACAVNFLAEFGASSLVTCMVRLSEKSAVTSLAASGSDVVM